MTQGHILQGMKRFAARDAVLDALADAGLYQGSTEHGMSVPVCSRTGDVIEPRLTEQWYLNCEEMTQKAKQVGRVIDTMYSRR